MWKVHQYFIFWCIAFYFIPLRRQGRSGINLSKENKYLCLQEHKETEHDGRQHPCDQCDFIAPKLSKLKQHIASEHDAIRHSCDKCSFSSARAANLRSHIERMHTKAGIYISGNILEIIDYNPKRFGWGVFPVCDFLSPLSPFTSNLIIFSR